ncbi:MAG: PD40 domain-containing protein [Spirochaetes bacterium]|nr:PD40 domain-containing protein [Spirochaetota bacterium]
MRIILVLLNIFILSRVMFSQSNIPKGFQSIKEINTVYHEFSPSISPDGSFMVFSSDRPQGLGDNDLWISYFKDGQWSQPENLSVLNSRFHDHEPFLTYDGNAILFSSDRDGGLGVGDLYISYRQGKYFSQPINLGPSINTKDSEKMPSVSMDNQELFFARIPVDYFSRMLEKNKIQIWVSQKKGNIWGAPELLQEPVNQLTYDFAPRIMPDGHSLLFCSGREGGKGGLDIWRVRRKSRSFGWSGLTNLSFLNTKGNESHYAFTIDQKRLYMAAQWGGKKDYDIYEYKVEEMITEPTITLQGRITNKKNGDPVKGTLTVELFSNAREIFSIESDRNGQYSITLPKGGNYSLTVEAPGFMFFSQRLDLTELLHSSVTNVDIGLHPLQKGENIIIRTIYFDPGQYRLRAESMIALDRVVKILKDHPNIRLLIKGHVAEIIGDKMDSMWLSEMRTKEVKKYMVEKGIDPDRLQTKGFGGTMPIGDNDTEEGRKLNRRTEFEILE